MGILPSQKRHIIHSSEEVKPFVRDLMGLEDRMSQKGQTVMGTLLDSAKAGVGLPLGAGEKERGASSGGMWTDVSVSNKVRQKGSENERIQGVNHGVLEKLKIETDRSKIFHLLQVIKVSMA